MAHLLPLQTPTALQYFASLVASDDGFPLLEAAISVAQDDNPALDVQGTLAEIDALADRLRRRMPSDAAPIQRLRLLNPYFFQELGFSGNVNDYYDRGNSLLPTVLHTRRGIPISLALIYLELATQLGLKAQGVSFPGHFLVKVRLPRGDVVLDPFTGQSLGRDELESRLRPFREQRGLGSDDDAPLGLFLSAASDRDVLTRLLRNLEQIHRMAGDRQRLQAVLARLVVLLPAEWEQRRDHAIVLAEMGQRTAAAIEMALYLSNRPQAPDAPALRLRLAAWQR
jgi:regulator of sirC expression with transglutaminase-like and TPR domain